MAFLRMFAFYFAAAAAAAALSLSASNSLSLSVDERWRGAVMIYIAFPLAFPPEKFH